MTLASRLVACLPHCHIYSRASTETCLPIYRYTCAKCENEFEELIRSTGDERSLRCPVCGGRKIERQLSSFAAHSGSAHESMPVSLPRGGGCGRCGDPQGLCGL